MYNVYIHKLYGHIVYIGSGSRSRYRAKTKCRSRNHLELWNDLTFEIVAENLTKNESLDLEQKLIDKHWDGCLLLNVNRKVQRVHELNPLDFTEKLTYSENSPSGLIWTKDIYGGRKHSNLMIRKDTPAGSLTNRGYWSVEINKKGYSAHRIAYALYHNISLPVDLVIDHIDMNPSNNKISNLRLVTNSENNKNRNFGNKSLFGILFESVPSKNYFRWRVNWIENGKRKSKSFKLSEHLKSYDFDTAKELTFQEALKFKMQL